MESEITESITVLAEQNWIPKKIGSELIRLQESSGELEGKAELRDYGKSLGLKKYQIESKLGFNK